MGPYYYYGFVPFHALNMVQVPVSAPLSLAIIDAPFRWLLRVGGEWQLTIAVNRVDCCFLQRGMVNEQLSRDFNSRMKWIRDHHD